MFRDFLDKELRNHKTEDIKFLNEVSIITLCLENEGFRNRAQEWMESQKKIKNERILKEQTTKIDQLVHKMKKTKPLLEKYNFCNQSLGYLRENIPNSKEIRTKIFYERANILIKTGNNSEAYDDLCMCEENGINDVGLVYRKGLCALKLNRFEVLKQHVDDLKKLYDGNTNASDELKLELEKYRTEYEKLSSKTLTEVSESVEEKDSSFLQKYKEIRINQNVLQGRHVLAQELININTEILTEKAFAFVPLRACLENERQSLQGFDCQKCAKTNIVPYFCLTCSRASYCSVKCLQDHQIIHQNECEGYTFDLWHEIGIAYLAFRTFLTGFNCVLESMREHISLDGPQILFSRILDEPFDSYTDQYRLLLSLQSHFESLSIEDLLSFALTSSLLTLYLKHHTNFFTSMQLTSDTLKWEVLIGSLIMRHLGQMVCNAHTMYDLRFEYNGLMLPCIASVDAFKLEKNQIAIRNDEIFSGIFPIVSLLNHSCVPNIGNRFNRNSLTIRAKTSISQDDEIFNNYGLSYLQISKTRRQEILKDQYHFDCKCKACLNSEDEYLDMKQIRCPKCSILLESSFDMESMEISNVLVSKCVGCGEEIDVKKLEQILFQVCDIADTINDEKSFKSILNSFTYGSQRLHKHHNFTYFNSKLLLASYSTLLKSKMDSNTMSQVKKIAHDMLEICEHIHGKQSVEYFLDTICIIKILEEQKEDLFECAKNLLSDQSFSMFKILYKYID